MAVEILSPREIEKLRVASQVARATLRGAGALLKPGLTAAEIDAFIRADTARVGGTPSQLGYHGFPASVCVSRNEVICHGIPTAKVVFADGDIVNLDVTTKLNGFHGDTSETFFVGTPSPEARHLVESARRARDAGIAVVRPGATLGDIGFAIQEVARAAGCTIVREFGGHGIGRNMHMDPHVSHFGARGAGLKLRAGMAFTIEPMLNLGGADIKELADGWTIVTADGKWSAQCEHTVVVTATGVEVLTRDPDDSPMFSS